jgi:hypothetical protein
MRTLLKTTIATLCLSLSSAALSSGESNIKRDIKDPKTIAIINGDVLPTSSANIMLSAINRGKKKLNMIEFLQGSIENKLLADYGVESVGIEAVIPSGGVGFDLDVALEDQFINVIRLNYEEPLQEYISKNFSHGNLLSAATKPLTMTRKQLKPHTIMKNKKALGFTEDQIENAKTVELIRYKLPGQKTDSAITLWDIYRRQNVQGKDILHKADMRFVKTQVQQRLGSLLVLHWMNAHSGLSTQEIDAIKELVFNKHFKKLYITHQGLVSVLHKDNPRLTEVAKKITQAEVDEYYKANKEDYKQINRARGRQIISASSDDINAAFKAIQAGQPFEEVAKKYSTEKNKKGNVLVDTGWISREENSQHWLKTLLFLQPIGEASRPYRSPQLRGETVHWRIVIADEKEEDYQAADSGGVTYPVSRILAERKLTKEFGDLRKRLLTESKIRLNPELLKPPTKKK